MCLLQVYPGGLFKAKNLLMEVDTLLVDVMGTFTADGNGYCDMGKALLMIYS